MTTGNTGHQAPTTGAGTSPGLGCRSLGRPLCQRWQGPDLIAQAGAGPELDAYLQARNIHRTATLAVMGADLDQFKKAVVAPWAAGYTDSARNTAIDAATVAKPAVPTLGALSVATAFGRRSFSEKVRKDFPQWADQIELYNKRLLGSERREFPVKELL
ncbi:unnamed protein product, partial [Symbiodinium pilosum]